MAYTYLKKWAKIDKGIVNITDFGKDFSSKNDIDEKVLNYLQSNAEGVKEFTDDLRELKETIILTPKLIHTYDSLDLIAYEVILPSDYLHILNCICVYDVINAYKCLKPGCTCKYKATKLTADAYS